MAVLPLRRVVFEWDDGKAASNLIKHGVTFLEAATIFFDDDAIYKRDHLHSDEEQRCY